MKKAIFDQSELCLIIFYANFTMPDNILYEFPVQANYNANYLSVLKYRFKLKLEYSTSQLLN